MKRIVIIDGNSLLFRAFYAMQRPMITSEGVYTQGIYGFLIAILVMVNTGLLGTPVELTVAQGWSYFFATLPMAVVGLISGIAQGKTAAAAIQMTGKQPDASGKGITMTALVETYAILALLTSILLLFSL
jgi:V/A-type H+-transporting ATPase subunit K